MSGSWEEYYTALSKLPKRLEQPASFVAEALTSFKRQKIRRVLDLGCGAGRHCVLLAKKNFEILGVDVSNSALKIARQWVKAENLKNTTFLKAAMTSMPFRDSHFGAVVSVSVIHHALKRDIIATIREISRILKKNGVFIANLASVNDPRYAEGEEVETGTFRILEDFEEKSFEELHHFFTKEEALKLLSGFAKAKVEPLKDKLHYWKVMAVK